MFLPDLILKSIGIYRVKLQTALFGKFAQFIDTFRFIPRNMQRNRRGRTNQFIDRRAIFEFFVNAARFARAGKTRKTGAARADSPRRHGNLKTADALHQIFDFDIFPPQSFGEIIIIFRQNISFISIVRGDKIIGNFKIC